MENNDATMLRNVLFMAWCLVRVFVNSPRVDQMETPFE